MILGHVAGVPVEETILQFSAIGVSVVIVVAGLRAQLAALGEELVARLFKRKP